ncbi:twin-arginine translocase subunit TatB [Marinobacter sp. R17]|uniref:Sec-independent protein translocase protein TatB n=1 Tax=Marinobacter TaxID=2742 RepID=UPI000F4C9FA5|nr:MULTISPECIES: Sec-independent protein translocase protein TatB [Marinobacter]ROU00811.1 twin-arginine translocase subunit TatB [Marinobacter sp. R17]
MFDIGFMELLICGIIALLVLGPERLPGAARSAGRWVGRTRRLVRQFTSELDRQIKAEELKEQLRKEGGIDLDGVEKNVRDGLSKARDYEHLLVSDEDKRSDRPAPPAREEALEEAGYYAEQDAAAAAEQRASDSDAPQDKQATPENRT